MRSSLQRWQRHIYLVLLATLTTFFTTIRTARNNFPEDDNGPCQQGIENGIRVLCWLRINPHGWPITAFEYYRHRWFAYSPEPPQGYYVTHTMKQKYERQKRADSEALRRTHNIDNRYIAFADRYPHEAGTKYYWLGFPANLATGAITAAALLAIISTVRARLIRLIESRRRIRGVCVHCKYDMRGSIESGRCPECGSPWNLTVSFDTTASQS